MELVKKISKKAAMRTLDKVYQDNTLLSEKLANMACLLEAIVTKHGTQTYTRLQLEKHQKGLVDITIDQATETLTLKLRSDETIKVSEPMTAEDVIADVLGQCYSNRIVS